MGSPSSSVALAVILALLAGPLTPAIQAWSAPETAMCALHGRGCTCPQACNRADSPHAHGEPVEQAPACHRSAEPSEASEPKCEMQSCGAGESYAGAPAGYVSLGPVAPETGLLRLPPCSSRIVASYISDGRSGLPPPVPPPRI